jgi:alpha-tubulin suppressor-like RCC1 family protein
VYWHYDGLWIAFAPMTGGVRCWGSDEYGQLGDGNTKDLVTPPQRDVLTGAQAIATSGIHTCALMVCFRQTCVTATAAAS